jgi:hypothetical protein
VARLEVEMETLGPSIEDLRAELARQDEERARLSRAAARNEDVRFALSDEVDAKIGALLERIEASARQHQPRPTFVGVRA